MTLSVDKMDEHGHSNTAYQGKEDEVDVVLAIEVGI